LLSLCDLFFDTFALEWSRQKREVRDTPPVFKIHIGFRHRRRSLWGGSKPALRWAFVDDTLMVFSLAASFWH
jgi:hypothetical protein